MKGTTIMRLICSKANSIQAALVDLEKLFEALYG
jgi:hypothetical protein